MRSVIRNIERLKHCILESCDVNLLQQSLIIKVSSLTQLQRQLAKSQNCNFPEWIWVYVYQRHFLSYWETFFYTLKDYLDMLISVWQQHYFSNLRNYSSRLANIDEAPFCLNLTFLRIKGYSATKKKTSQNVSSEQQVKSFFISQKSYVTFSRYLRYF